MSDSGQVPGTGIVTQAQLLRAVAGLVERYLPDLPAAARFEHVFVSSRSEGWTRNRVRRAAAALAEAGVELTLESDDSLRFTTPEFQVGGARVAFKFYRRDVAEPRVQLVEGETWALVPPGLDDGDESAVVRAGADDCDVIALSDGGKVDGTVGGDR